MTVRGRAGRRGYQALAFPRGRGRARRSPADEANFRKAAEAALRHAKPQSENGFKIELAKRCLDALKMAAKG